MSKQRYKDEVYIELGHLKDELDLTKTVINKQRTDIKRLIVLLIENDIPLPEDLITSYILKKRESKISPPYKLDDDLPFY